MNTTDTNTLVNRALEGGYGLWIAVNNVDKDLFGDELREAWDDLAPGESFKVLGVITTKEGKNV